MFSHYYFFEQSKVAHSRSLVVAPRCHSDMQDYAHYHVRITDTSQTVKINMKIVDHP